MSVQIYRSTDQGAPVLNGGSGVLAAFLDAILLNGYNSQKVTLSEAKDSRVVTVTEANHNRLDGDLVTIDPVGNNNSSMQGEYVITVTGVNTYTYTIKAADAPTTAIVSAPASVKKASCGWTSAFGNSSTAKSYRSPILSHYLEVDDTIGKVSSVNSSAQFSIYSTMSALMTGTDKQDVTQFYRWTSTNSPHPNLLLTDNVHWMVISNGPFVIFLNSFARMDQVGFSDVKFMVNFFGEFPSLLSGDAYRFIAGSHGIGHYTTVPACLTAGTSLSADSTSGALKALRQWDGAVGASFQLLLDWQKCQGVMTTFQLKYPDVDTGGVVLQKANLWEIATKRQRGYLPGIWFSTQDLKSLLGSQAILNVTSGDLVDRKFLIVPVTFNTTDTKAHICIEISDTWLKA